MLVTPTIVACRAIKDGRFDDGRIVGHSCTMPDETGRLLLGEIPLNETYEFGNYVLTEDEIMEMAQRFDPQPWHLDLDAAAASVFGELVAPFCLLECVISSLFTDNPVRAAVVAGLGRGPTKIIAPGRVGDRLRLRLTYTSARPSVSHPGTGVVTNDLELVDQGGRVLVSTTAAAVLVQA